MKQAALFCLFAILSSAIITSCLGDSGQEISVANQLGVVKKSNDSTYIYVVMQGDVRRIFASGFNSQVDDGDCIRLTYVIDFSKPENGDSGKINGYITANAISDYYPVEKSALATMSSADTTTIRDNETILSTIQNRRVLMQNCFFLVTELASDTLPYLYELSYNADQVPEKEEGGNYNVYDLFLRITKDMESDSTTQDKIQYRAFDISRLASQQRDSLYFRINYVKGFNKDTTALNWQQTEIYRFSVEN